MKARSWTIVVVAGLAIGAGFWWWYANSKPESQGPHPRSRSRDKAEEIRQRWEEIQRKQLEARKRARETANSRAPTTASSAVAATTPPPPPPSNRPPPIEQLDPRSPYRNFVVPGRARAMGSEGLGAYLDVPLEDLFVLNKDARDIGKTLRILMAAVWYKQEIEPFLWTIYDRNDASTRRLVLLAMSALNIGDPSRLKEILDDADADTAIQVFENFHARNLADGVPSTAPILFDTDSQQLFSQVLHYLQNLAPDEAGPVLLDLIEDRSPNMSLALERLFDVSLTDEERFQAIEPLLTDSEAGLDALMAARRLNTPEMFDALIRLIGDSRQAVDHRLHAVRGLYYRINKGDPDFQAALRVLWDDLPATQPTIMTKDEARELLEQNMPRRD